MATNVKILLRRGKRAELTGQTLVSGEMGYTTDTNQLYVGTEVAVNEIRFDPFTNAHATIQSWLNSADCPTPNLVIDEDLVITDIPAGKIDAIMTALNTYSQSVVFNTVVATFNLGELLTQYKKKPTILTSPNLIPNLSSITSDFTVGGDMTSGTFVVGQSYTIKTVGTTDFMAIGASANTVGTVFTATAVGTGTGTATIAATISESAVSNTALVTTLQANATITAANIIVTSNADVSKLIFTKIDGEELNITFPTTADANAIGFTQSVLSVNAGSFVVGTSYTITSLGTDTLTTVTAGAFVIGTVYTILTAGTTDFVAEQSATANTVGTVFTATATGTGTGTATRVASTVQQNWEAAGAPAVTAAGSFVVGTKYAIVSVGTTDFTAFGSANNTVGTIFTATNVGIQEVAAGSFVVGRQYTISTIGNTDFTLIGATTNTVGLVFTASGVGTGTGFANYQGTGVATSVIVGTVFKATGVGQGNGTTTYDNGVNTVAAVAGYSVYANGKISTSTNNKSITAGAFVVGRVYTILVPGTTNFTLIGSADSIANTVFTATGVGSGTGTAKQDKTTTVVAEVNENSDYFKYQQEGAGSKPYSNAPDNSAYFYFGTPSTANYSSLSPSVESTSVSGSTDTKIGLFGHKRMNVEVLTEESRNQLFANQHLVSHASSTGLRSDLYKKALNVTVAVINATACVSGKQYEIVVTGTTDFTLNGSANSTVGTRFTANATAPLGTGTVKQIGTFLKYPKGDSTSFFVDYSLKQTDSTNTFVRVGTLRVINGVPQGITKTSITDENTEVWQDDGDNIAQADEFSNITFNAVLRGNDLEINYTQDATFTSEISYTVKRWTM